MGLIASGLAATPTVTAEPACLSGSLAWERNGSKTQIQGTVHISTSTRVTQRQLTIVENLRDLSINRIHACQLTSYLPLETASNVLADLDWRNFRFNKVKQATVGTAAAPYPKLWPPADMHRIHDTGSPIKCIPRVDGSVLLY